MSTSAQEVAGLIAELLGVKEEEVHVDRPLAELGIDSLTAAEVSATIETSHGVIIPMERFLGDETLSDVARDLETAEAPAGT